MQPWERTQIARDQKRPRKTEKWATQKHNEKWATQKQRNEEAPTQHQPSRLVVCCTGLTAAQLSQAPRAVDKSTMQHAQIVIEQQHENAPKIACRGKKE
jgi:hypothetical protein